MGFTCCHHYFLLIRLDDYFIYLVLFRLDFERETLKIVFGSVVFYCLQECCWYYGFRGWFLLIFDRFYVLVKFMGLGVNEGRERNILCVCLANCSRLIEFWVWEACMTRRGFNKKASWVGEEFNLGFIDACLSRMMDRNAVVLFANF